MDNHFSSNKHCVTIKYNAQYHFESYLERLSWINIFCSLHETDGLKIYFEIGISILCFRRRPQQASLHPVHCDVECFSCNMKITNNVYFQWFRDLQIIYDLNI